MATKHIIYTTALTLYANSTGNSGVSEASVTEDGSYPGVYPIDTDYPYVFVQAGGAPASSDTALGDVREFYYGTVADGDLYHATRFHAWDWDNAALDGKVKALYTATRAIDKFQFIGCKVDEDQGLEFPRDRTASDGTVYEIGGTDGVPVSIEQACYLIADALAGGRDPQADFEAQNVKVETFGPVRTEMATDKGPQQHVANLIPSPSAWALILPFLGISTAFSVNKG